MENIKRFPKSTQSDSVWLRNYKGIPIKSDYRVHDAVVGILENIAKKSTNRLSVLDIATGSGALTQRIADSFPLWEITTNDFEGQSLLTDFRRFSIDLNLQFSRSFEKYDVILCVEILEHLENPWNFTRELRDLLLPGGVIILTTPNTDSVLDRINYARYGHAFYFGEPGYINSGGHITSVPDWLMRKILELNGFESVRLFSASTRPFIRKKLRPFFVALSLYLKITNKPYNHRSINIYLINSPV